MRTLVVMPYSDDGSREDCNIFYVNPTVVVFGREITATEVMRTLQQIDPKATLDRMSFRVMRALINALSSDILFVKHSPPRFYVEQPSGTCDIGVLEDFDVDFENYEFS